MDTMVNDARTMATRRHMAQKKEGSKVMVDEKSLAPQRVPKPGSEDRLGLAAGAD